MSQDDSLEFGASERSPDDEVECVIRQFHDLLRGRLLQDQLLLWHCFLGRPRPVVEVAQAVELSAGLAHAKLVEFQADAHALRDLRQPPHATD